MKNIKKEFKWFEKNKDLVYFDNAATSLKPKSTIDAIVDYYENYSMNSHNEDSDISFKINEKILDTRKKLAKFINANSEEIIFTSGATEGLNLFAFGLKHLLKKGDEIILTTGEHNSNIIPWLQLKKEIGVVVKFVNTTEKSPTFEDFDKLITNKTKIVSFSNGFNLTSTLLDEEKIVNSIKNKNKDILVILDVTQSIIHKEVDVKKTKVDFLTFSAHKIFGPTGIGACYIKKEHFNTLKPIKYGGGSVIDVHFENFVSYDDHRKYEAGTPNIAAIFGWNAALDFINKIGYETIKNIDKKLFDYAYEKLKTIKDLEIYKLDNEVSTFAINFKSINSQDLSNYLGRNNIIVRSGMACAHLMSNMINTDSVVRISLGIYNDFEDIDKLYECLKKFKKEDILDGLF